MRGRDKNIDCPSLEAVNVLTGGGGGRSKPTDEAELVVPLPTKCTRANAVRKSSERKANPPQKRNESEAKALEPLVGGVMGRSQRRVTRSSQEFSKAAGPRVRTRVRAGAATLALARVPP